MSFLSFTLSVKRISQSFYTNVVDGVASLVEVISKRFVFLVFIVCRVFFEVDVTVRPISAMSI